MSARGTDLRAGPDSLPALQVAQQTLVCAQKLHDDGTRGRQWVPRLKVCRGNREEQFAKFKVRNVEEEAVTTAAIWQSALPVWRCQMRISSTIL